MYIYFGFQVKLDVQIKLSRRGKIELMKNSKNLFTVALIFFAFQLNLFSQALGYNNHRIACSADGNNQPDLEYTGTYNTADPDDWGATPAALVMLAKLQLQEQLVHYSYNNFMPSPPHTTVTNYMKRNTDAAIERFMFDSTVFFDVGTHKVEALVSLKNEMMKSSDSDPLYYIHMGPAEFFYQAVDSVVRAGGIEALSHVYIISHSGYNDNHLRRDTHHTMDQAIALSGNRLQYTKIQDQNNCDVNWLLWCSGTNYYQWQFLRDHDDPNLNWLWDRMHDHKHNKADISDAGMMYYLLTGDQNGSPSKFKNFLGYGIMLPGDSLTESMHIEEDFARIFPQRGYQLNYYTVPRDPWDDFKTWTTSNGRVAYVSPEGRIVGVSPGEATIIVSAGLGEFKDTMKVVVSDVSECLECSESCELIDRDGLMVFEAERFALKGSWKVVNDNLASSGKYITYYGANSYNSVNTAHEISYTFAISSPGKYTVKWFMRQPDEAEGDKSNDVYIHFDGNIGYAGSTQLTSYEKFVGRSKGIFDMNGTLDLHGSSSWLTVDFPAAGNYTLKMCGRSEHLQIDKIVFYKGYDFYVAKDKASETTETTTCMDDVLADPLRYDTLKGIDIVEEEINLFLDEKRTLSLTFDPTNATNKNVAWTSGNPEIATVNAGEITGLLQGTTKVFVQSNEGGFKDSCIINVHNIALQAIDIDQDTVSMYIDEHKLLTVTYTPENATNKTVAWSSGNPEIASVSDGEITGLLQGTTQVFVQSNESGFKDSCVVNVHNIALQEIDIDQDTVKMYVGESEELSVTFTPENATIKSFTWLSLMPEIVTVNDYIIEGIAEGEGVIVAKSDEYDLADSCIVVISSLTSIQNTEQNNMRIYPNPVRDYFNITLKENGIIDIVSLEGSIIQTTQALAETMSIKLVQVPAGNYIVRIRYRNRVERGMITVVE